MQAISGMYENGNISIYSEDIPKNIKRARLYIVMIPEDEENKNFIPMDNFKVQETSSKEDFKMIGLHKFFSDNNDDCDVDWEDCFGVK
jgi:hypothetical protein